MILLNLENLYESLYDALNQVSRSVKLATSITVCTTLYAAYITEWVDEEHSCILDIPLNLVFRFH